MLIEEIQEAFLLPRYDKGLTCDFELPDTADKEVRLKERKQNLDAFYTSVNEERERDGLEPKPWGDLPWIPFNLAQPGQGKTPPPKPSDEDGKTFNDSDKGNPLTLADPLHLDHWTEERRVAHWKRFVQQTEGYEERFIGPLQTLFRSEAEAVIGRLMERGARLYGNYAGWSKGKILDHIGSNKDARAINIDKEVEARALTLLTEPIFKGILSDAGAERLRNLADLLPQKFTVMFNVNDPSVLKWLGARLRKFSAEVNGTTFEAIEAILREGFSEGQPVMTIAATLREKFESWDKYRAPLIARTETIAATNFADREAIVQAELDEDLVKHWLSARDKHVRLTHAQAEIAYRKGIPIRELFIVGQDKMQEPGNGTLAEENCNCRCTMFYTRAPKK
jgi:hypothetical protein